MLTLVLGGARSGKSSYAVARARQTSEPAVSYVATCVPADEEMRDRVARHRAARPALWATIEEPLRLSEALARAGEFGARAVIIDCLTLWLANMLSEGAGDDDVLAATEAAAAAARAMSRRLLVMAVANEVGLGLVPETPLGRRFRDLHGLMNQRWAQEANEVVLMVAGVPVVIKRGEPERER